MKRRCCELDRIERNEFEQYKILRQKLECRCEDLCHLYDEQYYGVKDNRQIYITGVEVGRSGRILIQYADGDIEEKLYLPPEYLWRTDEEVRVLMSLDMAEKETSLLRHREEHRENRPK